MKRTLKFSLNLANTGKAKSLKTLSNEYKKTVNSYLSILSSESKYILSEKEVKSLNSPLSYRYKQCAKRQAIKIWKSWRRNRKKGSLPNFNGSLVLDNRFVKVEKAKNTSFNYWVRIATLDKGYPVLIPIKSYDYANNYFNKWELINGGRLQNKDGKWSLILSFEKKTLDKRKKGEVIGVDIGYRKLLTTSDKEFLGKDIKRLTEKSARRKQKSKNWIQTGDEIRNYVNRVAKLFFNRPLKIVVLENLRNLKKDKHKKWSKKVNRRFNFWLYGSLIKRIKELGERLGVQVVLIPPAYTSQECPACGYIEMLNRRGELFKCTQCSFSEDADYVGALNILRRFTGEPTVPQVGKSNICL